MSGNRFYPEMVTRYRGPGTAAAAGLSKHPAMSTGQPTSSQQSAHRSPLAEARRLLESERCVWCEQRPRLHVSLLCGECARHDPEGVFTAPVRDAQRVTG